jgi:hypothetical protein
MTTRKIDDQIHDYYAAQKPSPETIERVKQMIRAGAPVRRPRRRWIAAAAAVIALAGLSLVWTAARRTMQSPQQLAIALAHQAAIGHNERQELEFRVNDCAELQRKMKSLDFTPVEPAMMREMHMRIVGARYTTIGGEMAAQILYVDQKGIPCTLYEVRPVAQLARVAAGDHQVDGVHVAVWREKGLVMVLARPMA